MYVRCPNCAHVGRPKRHETAGTWITLGVLLVLALVFPLAWPVFIVALLLAAFAGKKYTCAKCQAPHPVPLSRAEVREMRRRGAAA